jgi:hypothetical protein
VFPDNEVRKGQLTMQLKYLREAQEQLAWPSDNNDLPVISWDSCMPLFVACSILALTPASQSKDNRPNGP